MVLRTCDNRGLNIELFNLNIQGLLANDDDPDLNDIVGQNVNVSHLDGQPIAGLEAVATSHYGAEVRLNHQGVLTYNPTVAGATALQDLKGDEMLKDSITYSIMDTHGMTSLQGTATIYFDVWGVNKGPDVQDKNLGNTIGVDEDNQHTVVPPGVLEFADAPEGDPFTAPGVVPQADVETITDGGTVQEVQTIVLEDVPKCSVMVS